MITLWADETALDESAAAGDQLSRLAADASGSKRRSLDSFQVALFEECRELLARTAPTTTS